MNRLFGPIFGTSAVVAATDDRAWLGALCEAETALARAAARAGLLDLPTALEIGAVCAEQAGADAGALGESATGGGNPVIPLVARLRDRVREQAGDHAARAVHLGATSQDVLDTAMMLVAHRALGVVLADLDAGAAAAASLAGEHRDTAMAGRTLLQQARPTTFGALAAVWGAGLDRSAAGLRAVRAELPVQLGGPAGTLAELYPHGPQVVAAFADELGLAVPSGVWHTERGVVHRLAGALGIASAAVAKVAGDVVLLAQTELGELSEAVPGGSSSMAHKRNPIAAVTARAAAMQAPGLVATLLAAGAPELQRGAGPWHAEWPALTALLRACGGAASRLRVCVGGLQVDAAAMARNLAGLADGADRGVGAGTGHAGELVDRYLAGRPS